MSAFVTMDAVEKTYGRKVALGPVSVALPEGSITGIAGPNGAGKSTFARLLCGFTLPTRGNVRIGAFDGREWRERHGIGYVPEELPKPWRCSVSALLRLRKPPVDHKGFLRLAQYLDALGDRRLDTLSKGQWRLVLVGYALLTRPSLVVLDEPDSGLDPDALDYVAEALLWCARSGSTVVVLSHQLSELQRVCDSVLFVTAGKVVGSVTAAEVRTEGLRAHYARTVLPSDPQRGSR